MLIPQEQIDFCLGRATEVAKQYSERFLAGDALFRHVDRLLELCQIIAGPNKPITLYELEIPKEESTVWGSFIETPHGFDICFVQDLNPCWRRYVICKELFHILLRDDNYVSMDLFGVIQAVLVSFPDHDTDPFLPAVSEYLAAFAAMEFLFPYKCRLLERVNNGQINYKEIAEKYKVPRLYVERYLSDPYIEGLRLPD